STVAQITIVIIRNEHLDRSARMGGIREIGARAPQRDLGPVDEELARYFMPRSAVNRDQVLANIPPDARQQLAAIVNLAAARILATVKARLAHLGSASLK